MKFTKLTSMSMTLKVGQGNPYTIPSSFSMRGTYTPRLMILADFLFKYCGNAVCMMKFTKLTSVTLKVGQGDPHTIPSSFFMRGTCTYTPRLMILAHFLIKISFHAVLEEIPDFCI
jgi:hypothetical protein